MSHSLISKRTCAALFIIPSFALALACDRDDNEKKKDEVRARVDLTGQWASTCRPSAIVPGRHAQLTYDFGALGGFTYQTKLFAEPDCKTLLRTETLNGTYTLPNQQGQGSGPIDFKVDRAETKPATEEEVRLLNDTSYCGFTDWQKDVARSRLDANCQGLSLTDNTTFHSLFDIRDNTLYLGEPQLLSTPQDASQRPKSVKLDAPLKEAK